MGYLRVIVGVAVVGAMSLGTGGCTKKPSQEEVTKVDEARAAAEGSERKLAELKAERLQLERALQEKEAELVRVQQERDELRKKLGKD